MRVHVESTLPCDADDAWAEVQTMRLLAEVASPVVRFAPSAGESSLPTRWQNLTTAVLKVKLFGIIPWAARTLSIEKVDPRRREIQTREYDALVGRWDHLISVKPLAEGKCQYSDDIEVQAGLLTPVVWLFADQFYRHRQRRWRRVAERLSRSTQYAAAMVGHA